ncbi:AzlC family ABC transporter permease [Rhodococcus sp. 27YEA15]|uniref:AzlC family ABC transporter permease n=1 Tax=Rhodococcus sp. 27YEA15 TaxID=3156259 RepID=UPI003C7E2122
MRSIWRTLDQGTVRASVLIALSVGIVGVSYGVTAGAGGFSIWQLLAPAILVLGASSEFLFVGIVAAGGHPMVGVLAGLLVNSRNFVYAMAAGSFLQTRTQRLFGAHLVNDETLALASAQNSAVSKRAAFWLCGIAIALLWPLGAVVGAILGSVVANPAVLGLDAAFPAVILALAIPGARERTVLSASAIGVPIAVCATPFVPAGMAPLFALPAMAVAMRLHGDTA